MRTANTELGVTMRDDQTTRRMQNRVELQEEPDHIGVWPDQAAADQERG